MADAPADLPDLLNGGRSALGRRWRLRAPDREAVDALARAHSLDLNVARLLVGRGVAPDAVGDFLEPRLRTSLIDPSALQDMEEAARVLVEAVESGRAVTVFADYDVDGASSAAQLIRWARHFGQEWGVYVPDRILEGYGPSRAAFEELKARGQELVVTVDCGAAAKLALEGARDIGLDVVVIDHHLMEAERPPALALVNPNHPDDRSGAGYLAAAGVTFLLLVAMNRAASERGLGQGPNLLDFVGLAALGTVCDVVPLIGANRAIVHQGLRMLSRRRERGIAALAEVARAGAELSTYDLGFLLGPRINAGGRIGEAGMGASLLLSDDPDEAMRLAEALDRVNLERRALQDDVQRAAVAQAQRLDHDDLPILVLADTGWHPGIIGIVAGRLKDRFGKPVILIGGSPDGTGKGSGRSIRGVNLGAAIAAAKGEGILTSGGGRAMAGGLSMDLGRLAHLRGFLEDRLRDAYREAQRQVATEVDLLLAPRAVDLALVEGLERVGPFGAANPRPSVALSNVRITYADRLRGGHVRCTFEDAEGARVSAIAFRADETGLSSMLFRPNPGPVHVLGSVKRDRFRGRDRVDFHVSDMAEARDRLRY